MPNFKKIGRRFFFVFFSRLRRGAPLCGARHRCAVRDTCGARFWLPFFVFFFRGCAASHALRDAAGRRCAAQGTAAQCKAPLCGAGRLWRPPRARNSGLRQLFCACGAHAAPRQRRGAPQVPQTCLKTFPLPKCIILQNFMSFRPVV